MKRLLVALVALGFAVNVDALGFFAYGGGGSLDFSRVQFSGTYDSNLSEVTSALSVNAKQFFDATYVQLAIGYGFTRGSTEPAASTSTENFATFVTQLSFSALLKFPFVIGPVAIFPLAGVEYKLNLTWSDDKDNNLKKGLNGPKSDLDELWLKGGVGIDIMFGSFFIRPEILVGFTPFSPGGTTLLSDHATGTISMARASFTLDVDLFFGVRF